MGETSGGQIRSGRQITLITPQRLSRFGIEVDEALRVGSSGFLGVSDTGDAELTSCRQIQKASDVSFSTSQRRSMICSRLNLFWAMGPPLAINLKNTNLFFGSI